MHSAIGYNGTVEEFDELIHGVAARPDVEGIMIFACDANQFAPESIDPILKEMTVPIFGGIFPQILYNGQNYERGTVVVGCLAKPTVFTVPKLSEQDIDLRKSLASLDTEKESAKTLFVWVDGLSSQIGLLVDELFNTFGLEYNYIGGGAGSLSFEEKPCLFTNEGLLQNCAVLAFLDIESGVGVRHGWQSLSGPYKVTECEKNVIKSLNWQPAFEVYRSVVEQHADVALTTDNFFDVAKRFPFGINLLNAEKIVRDPIIATAKNELICVGEIPAESFVDILIGNPHSLIQAAEEAYQLAQEAYQGAKERQVTIFINCISRALFLQDQFNQEMQAVYNHSSPMIGALTIGEIANSGRDYLQFYNKTAVVGIFEAEGPPTTWK